jgi:hypothetical protein
MGKLHSRCTAPPTTRRPRRSGASWPIQKQTLKPSFHVLGARVETTWVPGALSAMGHGESTCAGPPTVPGTSRIAIGGSRNPTSSGALTPVPSSHTV